MRWLRELLRPSLKCERVGHNWKQITIRGYQYPAEFSYRCVADAVTVTIHECTCCRERTRMDSDTVLRRDGLNSLSMPESDWETLRERGFLASRSR